MFPEPGGLFINGGCQLVAGGWQVELLVTVSADKLTPQKHLFQSPFYIQLFMPLLPKMNFLPQPLLHNPIGIVFFSSFLNQRSSEFFRNLVS